MKRVITIVLSLMIMLAMMPLQTFAAETGKIYSESKKDITGISNETKGTIFLGSDGDYQREKLTACKVTVTYDGKTIAGDLFKEGKKVKHSEYLQLKKDDGTMEITINTSKGTCVWVNFDPADRAKISGAGNNIPDSCNLSCSWTYDGISYTAETTILFKYDGAYGYSGIKCSYEENKLVATGYNSTHGYESRGLSSINEKIGLNKGENYFSFLEYGVGTMDYIGCAEDPDGKIIKEIKGYHKISSDVMEPMNIICVTADDDFKDGNYSLRFKDSTGAEKTYKFNFISTVVENFKVTNTGTTKVSLSWDPVEDAEYYRIQTGTGYADVPNGQNKYTFEGMDAGTAFNFTIYAHIKQDKGFNTAKSKVAFATKPNKVSSLKLTTGSGHYIKASWGKKTGEGYQVQIATNSKFTQGKKSYTVKSSKILDKKITKLTSGKKYYVRVRAYSQDSDGNKYYGSWSSAESITCK